LHSQHDYAIIHQIPAAYRMDRISLLISTHSTPMTDDRDDAEAMVAHSITGATERPGGRIALMITKLDLCQPTSR
jgi:hypothetical protein